MNKFSYTNHKGEIEERNVEILELTYVLEGYPAWGYKPGWFLHCFDNDRQDYRTFALSNIILSPDDKGIYAIDIRRQHIGSVIS